MVINATWSKPKKLENGKKHNLIYFVNSDKIPEVPRCYKFYTNFGGSISIHYIGRGNNLKSRVETQLNNARLMIGIKNSMIGKKYIMYCTIEGGNKTQIDKSVSLEKQMIKFATLEGHELINKIGTKLKFDTVNFTGNASSRKVFKSKMNILKS
jgi:hypothetical protein